MPVDKLTLTQRLGFRLIGNELLRQLSGDPIAAMTSLTSRLYNKGKLTDPYSQHPVVYSCVKLLYDEVAQVPFKIYTATPEGAGQARAARLIQRKAQDRWMNRALPTMDSEDFQEVSGHELNRLFDRPNPLQSGAQFWGGVVTFYSLHGECDIVCTERENVAKIPEWMVPSNPGYFTPKPANEILPVYWEYRPPSGSTSKLMPFELIRPRTFNPKDIRRGLSPLIVANQGLQTDWGARTYNETFFDNDASPGGFLLTERTLKRTQREDWVEDFEKRHRGTGNAFRWALLSGIKDVKLVGYTPKDLQFATLQRMSKEELAMIWRVPMLLLSSTDKINYATARAELRRLWTDTIIPIIRNLEDVYWAEFFQYIEGGRYWGAFDLSNVEALQEGMEDKLEQAKSLFDMLVPFNAINERLQLGFEPLPWGDTVLVNANQLPIEMVMSGATIEPTSSSVEPVDDRGREAIKISPHAKIRNDYIKLREVFIDKFFSKYKRYLFEYRAEVLKNADELLRTPESMANIIAGNQEYWDEMLIRETSGIYVDAMEASYGLAAEQIGLQSPFLTGTSSETLGVLQTRQNMLHGVNSRMFNNMRVAVADAIKENVSVNEVRQVIRDVMNFQASRATTVARTEVGSVMSEARHNEFGKGGVEYTLWSITDRLARRSHQNAQAEGAVKYGEFFSATDCRFPLDHLGPVGEVVNCRCVAIPTNEP